MIYYTIWGFAATYIISSYFGFKALLSTKEGLKDLHNLRLNDPSHDPKESIKDYTQGQYRYTLLFTGCVAVILSLAVAFIQWLF